MSMSQARTNCRYSSSICLFFAGIVDEFMKSRDKCWFWISSVFNKNASQVRVRGCSQGDCENKSHLRMSVMRLHSCLGKDCRVLSNFYTLNLKVCLVVIVENKVREKLIKKLLRGELCLCCAWIFKSILIAFL